jgi:large conductance mechanosensitive channel
MVASKSVKTVKASAAKTAAMTSDLLKEERRARRELATRLKVLEATAPIGAGVGAMNGMARKQVDGFVDFLREQSVVGLAIGLVLGTQMKMLVDSIVNNFISPLIGLLLPGKGALADKSFIIHAFGKVSQPFRWGQIVTTLISFVAVAAVVYALFKLLRLDRLAKKPADDKKAEKSEKDKSASKKAVVTKVAKTASNKKAKK